MESTVLLPIEEMQVINLARQLTQDGKRTLLRALIPEMDDFEQLAETGHQRIRSVAQKRGLDWDALSEEERTALIDDILHEESRD
jgi:predicted amidophosphoribosyltransferase